MNKTIKIIPLLLATLAISPLASVCGAPLISHSGSTNPVDEGWSASGTTSQGSPVTDAWRVNDNSTSASLLYVRTLTEAQTLDANTNGWVLSLTLQVNDINSAPNLARYADYSDMVNQVRWGMSFGSAANGDLIISLRGSAMSYTLTSGGYHSFSLAYDPLVGTASLYIDGSSTATFTGYTGDNSAAVTARHVRWGSASGASQGSADYRAVSFAVVPEPSTMGMLVLGTFALFRMRRMSRRA